MDRPLSAKPRKYLSLVDKSLCLEQFVENMAVFEWADRQVRPGTSDPLSAHELSSQFRIAVRFITFEDLQILDRHFQAALILGLSEPVVVTLFPEEQLSFGF